MGQGDWQECLKRFSVQGYKVGIHGRERDPLITLSWASKSDLAEMLDFLPPFSPSSFHSYSDYNPSFDSNSDSLLLLLLLRAMLRCKKGGESRPVLPLGVITGLGEGNLMPSKEIRRRIRNRHRLPRICSRGCNLL